MPWNPRDALSHTHKADTPKKQREWAHVANRVYDETGDDGRAVREANGVVARSGRGSSKKSK